MALVLAVTAVCWVGLCVLTVALCVAAKRGDAALAPYTTPLPAPVSAQRTRRGGARRHVAHGA